MAEQKIKGWLTEAYDYERPSRGQIRHGVIVKFDERGAVVDIGSKRDGIVPDADIERLGQSVADRLEPGQAVEARIVRPEDREGNVVLSMYQARLGKDWARGREMQKREEIARLPVVDYNKGGLVVEFGGLRGFVPGSHLAGSRGRHSSTHERKQLFEGYVGTELPLKVIEVDRDKRRLILSERLAQRKLREGQMERLLEELIEGEVVEGTVSHLCDFGAFVDLGGADGLIHNSELAWQYVRHPSEVVQKGDRIKVYVLSLDHKRKRIGLSLKRLQPHPWNLAEETYSEGDLVPGTVTAVTDFGAFVALETGVEGLAHISELADPPPKHPSALVKPGDELLLRILSIDAGRRRIALSPKQVSELEREIWESQQVVDGDTAPDDQPISSDGVSSSDNGTSHRANEE